MRSKYVLLVFSIIVFFSCNKYLPEDKDTIDPEAKFTTTTYSPTLGRASFFEGNFNFGNTSQPVTFEVVDLTTYDGQPAPEINDDVYPVQVWKGGIGAYTGLETSMAEIEAKRSIEYHKIFELRKHSGEVLVWPGIDVSKIRARPDSGYKFNVKVSNAGATRYFYNLRFRPYRPRPYEPSNYNIETGMITNPAVKPTEITNMVKQKDNFALTSADVDVFFNKKDTGNSLTFRFLDSAYNPINPKLFNKTDWQRLVHGFNMQLTDSYVKYDVAYPIPLVYGYPTLYTNTSGTRNNTLFSYERIGPTGLGVTARLRLEFAIFETGDWEIIFYFKNTSPKFQNY